MADNGEDSEAALRRLETALERIARHASQGGSARTVADTPAGLAEALDRLIERLRVALARR